MKSNKKTTKMDAKVLLSTLWIFVMFNYVYADIMGLMDPGLLNQFLTGTINGINLTQSFLFWAAVLMEIPIAMVLLSRVLKYRTNRLANIAAGSIKTLVMIASMFVGSGPTLYYMFFGSIEIVTTAYIVWYAWNWRNSEA